MNFYFAPMEGITGYVYRNAHHAFFGNIDKYFIPFIMPNQKHCLNSRELNDVLPEHNQGFAAVPQILTNRSEDFIRAAGDLKAMGYGEVNLNLGCPSRTVVSKGKGAGFLIDTDKLNRFLEEIFQGTGMEISIKTRIGKYEPEEFHELLEIYNQYPLKELIIHPRVQTDYYKNKPNLQSFREAAEGSRNPVCYNGDIFGKKDYDQFILQFPEILTVMLGRGLLADPGLARELNGQGTVDKESLRGFHDRIYEEYQKVLFGEKTVLFKMKELWSYLLQIFQNPEKYGKKIKKAEHLRAYEDAVESLFKEQELV